MSAKNSLTRAKKKQARMLVDQHRLNEAVALYEKICTIDRVDPEAWFMLGAIHQQFGQLDRAIPCYERTCELDPMNWEAAFYLGMCHADRCNVSEAIRYYQRVLALQPAHLQATCNIGSLLEQQGMPAAAVEYYQRALSFHPKDPVLRYNLGSALLALEEPAAAIEQLEESIRLQPDFGPVYANLGNALELQLQLKEAIECYQRGIDAAQPCYATHHGLAKALMKTGNIHAAHEHYLATQRLNPTNAPINSNYLLVLNYLSVATSKDLYNEHLAWAQRHASRITPFTAHANTCQNDRPLRVGYLSPDLRTHSVSYFLEPVLAQHDKRRFEIICYADVKKPDATTERLHGLVDGWRDISNMGNTAVADLIRKDGIDILVDLAGHAGNTRLLVFAHKPSPVQITWLGYPNTTGLSAIDYRLTDALADPVGQEVYHTEELVRLPNGFLCYAPPTDAPAVNAPPAISKGAITFGCFNQLNKITDEMLAVWSRILSHLPGSRLLVKNKAVSDPYAKCFLEERLQRHDIALDRVELPGWAATTTSHLAYYEHVDIALDTFPYHGTTTTCEALWMGVPVVTLAGVRHAARVGVSLLNRVGLAELVAQTPDEYVRIAVELARDQEQLSALRAGLRERMARSPLCDNVRFTHELEDAYRGMWETWRQNAAR